MTRAWTNLAGQDSDDALSSGFVFPRVPSSHPTTATMTTSSSGLTSPALSPPLLAHSPRLQQQHSSGFQSSAGSSSDTYCYKYHNGYSSPRASGHLDTLIERSYYDSPPTTADLKQQAPPVVPNTTVEIPLSDGWSPRWLRRGVLAVFLGVFAALAVVGEVVMWFLGRDHVEAVVEGVWTFMPVIISTILAVLWSRVEFQALQYTPWIKLHPKPSTVDETRRKQAYRTVLLDYVSMNSFEAVAAGFRNRHHIVVASVMCSLLLRIQIVLSTGIFHGEVHSDGTKVLTMRPGSLHAVVGIFCVLCALTLPMMYHAPPRTGITPRDPTSLAGIAAVLASSKLFLSRLTGTGNADMEAVTARLPGSWYTTEVQQPARRELFQLKQLSGGPMLFQEAGAEGNREETGIYRPWTLGARVQSVTLGFCAVLLAVLWAVFAIWGNESGFDTTGNLYFLWTYIPTLVMVLLALFLGRIDVDTRRLAPFIELASQKCGFRESLGLTYMNEFGLISAGKSFARKHWAVFLRKWMAMFGWLMPIFTAGLFAITELQQTENLELRQDTWFRSNGDVLGYGKGLNEQLIDDVLLGDSPKYPAWTWEDLAFPQMSLVDHGSEWPLPNTQLLGDVSATRAALVCETATLDDGAGAGLECASLDSISETAICRDSTSHAGFVASSCSSLSSAYPINYIWGSCSDDGSMTILMCNETFVEVNVHSTFRTEDLSIDTNSIPLVDSSSERPAEVTLGVTGAYEALADIGSDDSSLAGLDGFFKTLVLSRLDMPLDRLVSMERRNAVIVAIRLQHGILRAQALNSDAVRQPFTASDAPAEPSHIPTSVTYFVPRLTQSRVQTYALTALLAATLILAALSLRTIQRVTLPKNPGSIAAQASLLADSTIWWRLPDGAEHASDEALTKRLRRKTFRMGWFTGSAGAGGARNGLSERRYGISVVQDEGKVARVEMEGDSTFPGRYISMRPGVYGDVPLHEK